MTTDRKVFTLCARIWFDKVNGNSYYSLRIVPPVPYTNVVGDKWEWFIVPFTYGHGYTTYIARAEEFCRAYFPDIDTDTVRWVVDETEVMRKKDLHNGGK